MPHLLTFTLLVTLSTTTVAEDCLVSTNPPQLVESYPGVAEQHSDPEQGLYSAILENGDLIMLRYGRCELLKKSDYFSRSETISQTSLATWAGHLIASSSAVESFEQKITGHGTNFRPGDELLIEDGNGSHSIMIVPSESPYFRVTARYEWIPPKH